MFGYSLDPFLGIQMYSDVCLVNSCETKYSDICLINSRALV